MEKTTTGFTIGFKTHIGKVREMNQDSYAVLRRSELLGVLDGLIVVADGMGGGKGGEVASRIVAETLPNVAHEELADVLGGRKLDVGRMLRMGMERANTNVRHKGVEQPDLRGMGTTCVAVALHDGTLTVANAGDSRAYLLRDGKLRQLTDDHSEVWQQVLEGKMTREEAQKSKFRNRISKAIGLFNEVNPDIDTFELQEGDTVLLCSDGLTTEVGDADIARTLASMPTAQAVCDRLTEVALRKGGSDNITVVSLRYGDFTPTAAPEVLSDLPEADEEEQTDERAEWRQNQRQAQRQSLEPIAGAEMEASYEEDEADDYEEPQGVEEWPRPRRKRKAAVEDEENMARSGGFATVVIVSLLCLAAALGIALAVAMSNRQITLPKERDHIVNGPDLEARTDKELMYFTPDTVREKPVRDDVLEIDAYNNIIVAEADGRLLSITPPDPAAKDPKTGLEAPFRVTKLPDPLLPAPLKTDPKAKPLICVAFDQSLNRYQNDPESKCIFKYDGSGTRKLTDIGKKYVVAPTRMVVDKDGNIYLIDGHLLKCIRAYETTDQTHRDNDQRRRGVTGGL